MGPEKEDTVTIDRTAAASDVVAPLACSGERWVGRNPWERRLQMNTGCRSSGNHRLHQSDNEHTLEATVHCPYLIVGCTRSISVRLTV